MEISVELAQRLVSHMEFMLEYVEDEGYEIHKDLRKLEQAIYNQDVYQHITDKNFKVRITDWHIDGVHVTTSKGKSRFYTHHDFNKYFRSIIE